MIPPTAPEIFIQYQCRRLTQWGILADPQNTIGAASLGSINLRRVVAANRHLRLYQLGWMPGVEFSRHGPRRECVHRKVRSVL